MTTGPLPELSRLTAEKEYVPTSLGLSAGSEGPDVTRLQRYLQKFGYTTPTTQTGVAPQLDPTSGVFDESTVEALQRFQQFNGLPVTGELDAATLELMSRPRCGFPDHSVAGFAVEGSIWDHTNLTYAYQNFTPDVTDAAIRSAISQAFSLWAAVVPLTFAEVALGGSPDIIIRFAAGAHGDGLDFDGPGGTYAHAFYPNVGLNGPLAGDAHFDEDETWSVDLPPTGIDLVSIAAHEFGHSLGLLHSDVTSALMWPFYSGAHRYLDADDVAGIQSLYGPPAPPGSGGSDVSFSDDFERVSLGSDWADDGPILFQSDDWVRAGQFLSGGAWQADENNTAGEFETAMGSIRRTDNNCADQFIEAVVGNFFQGHDPSVDETLQWVEGDVWLFAQLSPGSDACIGAHFVIHVNSSDPDGEAFVEFFTSDEDGEVTFTDNFGSVVLPAGWQDNPDYTIRFEVSAAGHCKAYFEGDLLAEDDATPTGGRHVGIGMQWNRTSYPVGDPPNPGVSLRFESVTGSLCTSGWRVGRIGGGSGSW